ncbi:hypothetical protein DYB26_002898 [Aphanomyces astaci]|uniref:Uncharacterized protein n=1 Tax=Aphanomyces astaci TaxID=112090 RepID=A0A3R6XSA8_APHAT|nr:hypothetical protein DYB26_002898 [Aphanomyces astaci]
MAVPGGLGVTRFATLEGATKDSVERKESNLDPLVPMPFDAHVSLPTTPHVLSLSPSQRLLAVAFDSSLAIYELARLVVDSKALPTCLCNGADVLALSWSAQLDNAGDDQWLAVLTTTRQVHVYTIEGNLECLEGSIEATAHCWSPSNSILAVGDDEGVIHRLTYHDGAFQKLDTLVNPDNTENSAVHHINWAEADLLLAGYRRGALDDVEVTSCLFEGGNPIPLDQLVDFFPNTDAPREHAFYSCYLAPWRMFFVGCSLSTDIELLVSDHESGDWQKWKPEEKYTPRLPMNAADEDTYPVGMTLILNSSIDIEGIDDFKYAPCPLVLCATTEGLALNFALLDITVGEALEFVAPPAEKLPPCTRPTVAAPWLTSPVTTTATLGSKEQGESAGQQQQQRVVFDVSAAVPSFTFDPTTSRSDAFGQDTDNVFNSDDDSDVDDDEERAEEFAKASEAFDAVDTNGVGAIPLADFEKLFDALGTVYAADAHTRTIRKLDRHGEVRKEDFVAWYVDWIMADLDSDDDTADQVSDEAVDTAMKSDEDIRKAMEKFRRPEGSWKCDECMVLNLVAGAAACVACESPNPTAAAASKEDHPPAVGLGGASGGIKGISFGVFTPATTPPPKPKEATPATSSAPTTKQFQFGVSTTAAPANAAATATMPPTTSTGGFSFGVPSTTSTSTTGGFSFGVSSATTTTPATLDGTKQLPTASTSGFSFGVPPSPQKPSTNDKKNDEKTSYGNDTDNVFTHDDSDDDDADLEAEMQQEQDKASDAFDEVDSTHTGHIPVDKFELLFDALGTVYSADEHKKTLAKLTREGGVVFKKDFVAWYVDWIFAEIEDDDESDESDNVADVDPHAAMKSEADIAKAFAKFKAPAGSWKCSACFVSNPDEHATKCVACTTPRQSTSEPSKNKATVGSDGFGVAAPAATSGGFGFGSSSGTTKTNAFDAISFGAGNAFPDAKGFSFQPTTTKAPVAPKAASAYPPDTTSKPAVTFGSSPASTTTSGFSFGVKATPAAPKASSAYPPDTSSKPAFAFGSTAAPKASSAYPPDTSSKPVVAFGSTAAPKVSSAYPPDTSSKPVVAFGSTAAPKASSAYPPDTSSKPVVAFGSTTAPKASSAYPPDTSSKPAASSAYPPDTSSKPFVAFGSTAAPKVSSAYPPDTSSKPALEACCGIWFYSYFKDTCCIWVWSDAISYYWLQLWGEGNSSCTKGGIDSLSPRHELQARFGATKAPSLATTSSLKFGAPSAPRPSAAPSTVKVDTNTIELQKAMPASAWEGAMWNLINEFDRTFQRIRREDDKFVKHKSESEAAFIQSLKDLRAKVMGMCGAVDKLNDELNVVETDLKVVAGNCSDIVVQLECSNRLLKAMHDKSVIAHLEDQPLDQRSQNTRMALRSQLEAIERLLVEVEKHVTALKGAALPHHTASTRLNDAAQLFRVLKLNYDTSKREYTRVLELAETFKQLELQHEHYTKSLPKPTPPVATKELLHQLRRQHDTEATFRSNLAKWTSQPIVPREVSAPIKRQPLSESISASKPAPEVPQRVPSKLMFGAKTTIPSQATEAGGGLSFTKPPVDTATKVPLLDADKVSKSVSFSASTKPGAAFNFGKPSTAAKPPSSIRPNLSFSNDDNDEEEKTDSPRARKMSTSSKNGTPERSFKKSPSTGPSAAAIPTIKPLDFGAKSKDSNSGISSFSFAPSISKPPAAPVVVAAAVVTPPPPSTTAPVATPPDLVERLKSFYAAYNPGKSTAAAEKLLAQSKGTEEQVFHKLLQKYVSKDATVAHAKAYMTSGNVPEALKTAPAPSAPTPATTSAPPAFGKPSASPFGATPPSGLGTPSTAAKPAPSPFGTTPATAASPFGSTTTAAASSPFGAAATTAATPPAASPFGTTSTAWPSATAAPSPFGASSGFGVDYRSKVVEFYKQHNPDKLAEVDTVLQKYKGKEEELLKKLEAKYSKPQGTASGFGGGASPFGVAATPPAFGSSPFGAAAAQPAATGFGGASPFGAAAGSSPGFGAPSPFGASPAAAASPFGAQPAQQAPTPSFGATTGFGSTGFGTSGAAPAFGSTTALGGTAAPAFGATTSLGGGAAPAFGSTLGGGGFGGLGSNAPTFGASSTLGNGGGFSTFASNTAAAPSFGFGGQQSTSTPPPAFGGSGGGFGSGFTSTSFTQARR